MSQTLGQLISECAGEPGALLLVAEKLMDQYRSIPYAAIPLMQQHLHLTSTEIQSILSFYHYPLTEIPIVCYVEVCTAISCHMQGASRFLQRLCETLQVQPNEPSADGRLLVTAVNCLSACERAPAVHVNGEYLRATDFNYVVNRIHEILA